jgi:NADP-dependent alcohol dehydrogenase
MKAVAVIKEQKIDFILAVGGGSVIDGVKFISAAVHLKESMEILQRDY